MGSGVRSGEILEVPLKVVKVPIERVKCMIDIFWREREVDCQGKIHGWCTGEHNRAKGVGETAPDVVFDGIGENYVLETASTDLEIVRRITPRAKTLVSVVGEDRRVVKVRSVCSRFRTRI